MRNRGVEIYMMQPDWLPDQICAKLHSEMYLREIKRFIALSGIPMGRLVDMMAKAHLFAKHEGPHCNISITYLELSRWVQLFHRLITNGNQPVWSIWKPVCLQLFHMLNTNGNQPVWSTLIFHHLVRKKEKILFLKLLVLI